MLLISGNNLLKINPSGGFAVGTGICGSCRWGKKDDTGWGVYEEARKGGKN